MDHSVRWLGAKATRVAPSKMFYSEPSVHYYIDIKKKNIYINVFILIHVYEIM